GDKKGRTVLLPTLQNFHPCLGRQKSTTWLSLLNFCLYKPCAMCLSLLHFQPCAGSEPGCNCCLSYKYTYMQLRSPEVTRVNFHLSRCVTIAHHIFNQPKRMSHICSDRKSTRLNS